MRARSPKARASDASTAEKDATAPAEEVEAAEKDANAPAAEQPAAAGETTPDDEFGRQSASPAVEAAPKELENFFKGELPEEPWQNKRYSPDN